MRREAATTERQWKIGSRPNARSTRSIGNETIWNKTGRSARAERLRFATQKANESMRTDMLSGVTAHDVKRIVHSVLRDYGLRMRLREVTRLENSWDVVLGSRDDATQHITVAANSAHEVRRAVMTALKVDG
jgi:hypothetical protein